MAVSTDTSPAAAVIRPERVAMRTITLEEHFVSRRFIDVAGIDLGAQRGLDLSSSEVTDLAGLRLRHMDESGIDMQVISHVSQRSRRSHPARTRTSRPPPTTRQRPRSPHTPAASPRSPRYQ